eukprot:TRINITY_DN3104_c0_g1_i1.p1 TRINITY_DN3104_c0_g1~~TRINITY_DN3104_c0_g1_i1.p1  ORF type:complete len:170 (-),score=47.14 TRINITY_DN3104_c0_g1_i1:20-493(-)
MSSQQPQSKDTENEDQQKIGERNEDDINPENKDENNESDESDQDESEESDSDDDDDEVPLKFRNYIPRDGTLKQKVVFREKVQPVGLELLEKLDQLSKSGLDDTDLLSLAPKKPNWDLKRDLEGKFKKLEARTQRAILELLEENIRSREAPLSLTTT